MRLEHKDMENTTKLDVRVYPLKNQEDNATKAFASVTVADLVGIKGIRVIEGSKGLFVTMPQSRDNEGNYHDIAFPVNADLRKAINKAVLDEFKEAVNEKSAAAPSKTAELAAPKKSNPDEPEI